MVDDNVFVNVVEQCTVRTDNNRMGTGCGGQIAHPTGWSPRHQHDVDPERRRVVERPTGANADLALRIQQRAIQIGGDQTRLHHA